VIEAYCSEHGIKRFTTTPFSPLEHAVYSHTGVVLVTISC